ncbi:MAG: M20 family metallopeptidase [Actinobacteria bacterium]|nr:M20 family metallopeptidase [Actinomycetota bacterium]
MDKISTPILDYIEEHRSELVDLLQRMVRARSVHGDEERVAAIVWPELENLGFQVKNHPVDPSRPNLVATYRGTAGAPRLLCYAHLDTVGPGDEPAWTADPFGGEVKDGKIWGRGTCDHKGSIAAFITAFKALKAAGFEPKGDLIYVFDSDEEKGGYQGMRHLVAQNAYEADFGIYGCTTQISPENRANFPMFGPSNIIGSAMAAQVYKITVRGTRPPRRNLMYPPGRPTAMDNAAGLLQALKAYAEEVGRRACPLTGPSRMHFQGAEYEPSPLVGTPDQFSFRIYRRMNLQEDLAAERRTIFGLVEAYKAEHPEVEIDVELVEERPHTRVPEDIPVVDALRKAAVAVDGIEPRFTGAPTLTGLGWFVNEKRLPIVMFGYGNLDFHHSVDEHIAVDDLVKSAKVYALSIQELIG